MGKSRLTIGLRSIRLTMLGVILRWSIPLVALLVIGPIAGWLTWSLRALDGGGDTSLLLNSSIMHGLVALGLVAALALVVGVIGARLVHPRSGLFAAGLVLAWASACLGRVDRVITVNAVAGNGTGTGALMLEGLIVCAVGAALAFTILHVKSKPFWGDDAEAPEPRGLGIKAADGDEPRPGVRFAGAALAAIVIAGLIGTLLAQDTTKMQVFAAAVFASIAAGAAGRVIANNATAAVFIAAITFLGFAGPAVASVVQLAGSGGVGSGSGVGGGALVRAALAGRLLGIARPMPMDWLAGAFVGVPLGLSWAGSMVERHQPK